MTKVGSLFTTVLCCTLLFVCGGCKIANHEAESEVKEVNMPVQSEGKLPIDQKCGENFDSKSIPELEVNVSDPFISRTISFELKMAADKVPSSIQSTPLENFLPKTEKVPGVVGTKVLIGTHFGPTGSRRLVCLTDHSTAAEEVIENKPGSQFKYKVWNYSSEVAKPIEYAVGEFIATPISANKSLVKWTYSFKLKTSVFPGNLMAPGRFLFKKSFVDGDYAVFMASAAEAMKTNLVVP